MQQARTRTHHDRVFCIHNIANSRFVVVNEGERNILPHVSVRQHTSAYVSIRQHTPAYVSIRQHTSAYVSIRHAVNEGEKVGHSLAAGTQQRQYLCFCTSKAS